MSTLLFVEDHDVISIVKSGSVIYRGQTDAFDITDDTAILRRSVLKNGHTYFGLDADNTTENYGITAELLVTTDLKLLNIHKPHVWKMLHRHMTDSNASSAIRSLERAFPLVSEVVKRNSSKKADYEVLDYICRNNIANGYIQPQMPKADAMGGTMHSEIAVCNQNIGNILEKIGSPAMPPVSKSYRQLKNELVDRRLSQQLEESRAERFRQMRDRFDMDDDSDEDVAAARQPLFEDWDYDDEDVDADEDRPSLFGDSSSASKRLSFE